MDTPPLIAIVGSTASGKSAWGLSLAGELGRVSGEIVGADSRQVYRRLEIGTAKPTALERAAVPHHLIGHVEPHEQYHLSRYLREARAALAEIRARGKRPIIVGGTGQYAWALLEGWSVPEVEPDADLREALTREAERDGALALHGRLAALDAPAALRIHPNNVRRVIRALEVHEQTGRPISAWHAQRRKLPATILGPRVDPDELQARIEARVDSMFAAGLVAETRTLLDQGLAPDAPGLQSIGYRQVVDHLTLAERPSLDSTIEAVKVATRRLARAQAKWFRADDARIRWCASLEEARALVAAPD